jgi:hypothetical protein
MARGCLTLGRCSVGLGLLFFEPTTPSARSRGREENIPELWRRHRKFHRYQRPFRVHLRRPHHMRLHLLLRLGILQRKLSPLRQSFRQNNHCPTGTHSMRKAMERVCLARQMHQDRHPQQHSLRAPPLFIRLRTHSIRAALHLRSR